MLSFKIGLFSDGEYRTRHPALKRNQCACDAYTYSKKMKWSVANLIKFLELIPEFLSLNYLQANTPYFTYQMQFKMQDMYLLLNRFAGARQNDFDTDRRKCQNRNIDTRDDFEEYASVL